MREHGDFEARFGAAVVRYLEAAPTRIDPMIVARDAAGGARRPSSAPTFARRRWVWLGAVLLLMALVVVAIFVGSGTRERDLASGPANVPSLGLGGFTRLVLANDGTIWSQGENGGLAHFDPETGITRVLGPWDDAVFARSRPIAAAAGGGVWVVDGQDGAFVRVDTTGVIESRPTPDFRCGLWDGAELVATCGTQIHRWDGSAWTDGTEVLPGATAAAAFVTLDLIRGPTLWRRVDGAWTWSDMDPDLDFEVESIAMEPGGAIWVSGGGGLARLDGATWRRFPAKKVGLSGVQSLTIAPDGSLWGAGVEWTGRTDERRAIRYDGRSFEVYDLPVINEPSDGVGPWSIVATPQGVFVKVEEGLAKLEGDRFEVVDPGPPIWLGLIQSLAVDGDGRVWVLTGNLGGERLLAGHLVDGAFVQEPAGPKTRGRGQDLTVGPDGRLWMASDAGLLRLDDRGRPELVGGPLKFRREGESDAQPPYAIGVDGTPYAVRGERILHLVDDTWEPLPEHPGASNGTTVLAVAPDGAIWVVTGDYSGGLGIATYRDGRWESVLLPRPVSGPIVDVSSLAFDAEGSVWARLALTHVESCDCNAQAVGRLTDGAWTVYDQVWGSGLGRIVGGMPALRAHRRDDIVLDREGTVWVNGTDGVARFEDGVWTWAVEGLAQRHLVAGADGSIWAAGPGLHQLRPT